MRVKAAVRDRPDVEVAVLDALAERPNEGMTVLSLRSRVDADIDELEAALEALKAADLIEVERADRRTVIRPRERILEEPTTDEELSIVESLRRRFGF